MSETSLSNPRHEAFARALASGTSATAAYAAAGYRGDRKNAARLATNGDVRGRVAALQRAAADEAVVTQADVLRRLLREADLGADDPNATASAARVGALKLLGQYLGMWTDRVQHEAGDGLAQLVREGCRPLPVGMTPAPRPEHEVDD